MPADQTTEYAPDPSAGTRVPALPAAKCPTPFVSIDAFSCVMPCPTNKQYVREGASGNFSCAYSPSPDKYRVPLVTVGAVAFNGSSLEDLQSQDIAKYTEFTAEKDRFTQAMTVAYGNIDKKQQIQDAFVALQAAENVRDQSPEAYQVARTNYYTLLNGEDWLAGEKERIAAAEVEPEIQRYRDSITAIDAQKAKQQQTIDIVNGIKDKVLSLKDDFGYSVNVLSDQVEKVKLQLNMENRSRDKDVSSQTRTAAWIDTILNVLLVAALVYAVYFLGKRFLFRRPMAPATVIRVPTYTGSYI